MVKMNDKIMVKVFRYNPSADTCPRYETYRIPAEEPASVLSLLRYVRDKLDPTLAFRDYICYKGVCATCMMTVNGKVVKACSTRISPGNSITVEPVLKYPVLRDLVVDFGTTVEGAEASYFIRRGALVEVKKSS